jgi:cytochrome c-type biogenesis protein CcmH/NrfG
MSEYVAPLSLAVSLVLVAAIVCGVALAAWRGWLQLKQMELQARGPACVADEEEIQETGTGARIELAAVKERLRRLEAIANGVEL